MDPTRFALRTFPAALAVAALVAAGCSDSSSGGGVATSLVGTVADQTNCADVLGAFAPRGPLSIFFTSILTLDSCARALLTTNGTLTDGVTALDVTIDGIVNIQAIRVLPTGVDFTFDKRLASLLIQGTYTDPVAGDLDVECQLRGGTQDFVGNSVPSDLGCTFFPAGTRTPFCALNVEQGGMRLANAHKRLTALLSERGDCVNF